MIRSAGQRPSARHISVLYSLTSWEALSDAMHTFLENLSRARKLMFQVSLMTSSNAHFIIK